MESEGLSSGPHACSGNSATNLTASAIYQHESMLRTVMEALQLSNPPGTAASAPDMAEFFVQK